MYTAPRCSKKSECSPERKLASAQKNDSKKRRKEEDNEMKKIDTKLEDIVDNTKVIKITAADELKKSFISYAMAVNVSRAIPDVRDGLKPVHRRIIYAMSELNFFYDKPHRKCARIVGEVLGKFHPHGDTAVYDALVRLAQDFSIRYPLIDGQGNFGSVDGDPAAAQRYTEARLSKISSELLRDIDKETIDFVPNFDGTERQPSVLPSRFPNLLVNGSDGIAVGMATNIPPHNLKEIIDGVVAVIKDENIAIEDLIKLIPAPDYPTGAIILGRNNIRQAYLTGRGGVAVRARAEIVESKLGKSQIIVTELPYQVNKARLIEQVAELVKDKKIEGITDIREESDRTGMRIVFDIKASFNAHVVLNTLYKHTALQQSNGITFLALVNNEPKVLNLKEMLVHYANHQKDVVKRRTKFDLARAEERKHIVEGLVIAQKNIDEVIKIIKKAVDPTQARVNLMAKFMLSERQANAILEMRLARLTSLEVNKLVAELNELTILVAELKAILASKLKMNEIIIKELEEIKTNYGDDRRSEIVIDESDLDLAALTEKQDVVISLTHLGYIKRVPAKEYESQRRGGKGVTAHKPREEDFVEQMIVCSTHDEVALFSSAGKVYTLYGYEIPQFEKTARGRAIINLLPLASEEKIESAIKLPKDKSKGNIIIATTKGLIKKTALKEFESIRANGKIAIKLLEKDQLLAASITDGKSEVIVASHSGNNVRFSEKDVRAMGRTSQGVKSMTLKGKKDYVVDMVVLEEGTDILTISEKGYGKRSNVDDYRLQKRGGKGTKSGVFNEQTGKLVCLKQVTARQDIMIISDTGIIIRVRASEISKIGRNTKGVRLMRLKDAGEIASVAVAAANDEMDIEATE